MLKMRKKPNKKKVKAEMTKKELFLKVLGGNMQSCNGGRQQWQIGKRVTVKGKMEMCNRGLHLTLQPSSWQGTRVFIAETSKVYDFQTEDMKAVCRSAKLLMELSPEQLEIYEEGDASLWKAYAEGRAPLLKAYKEGKASLWKAYKEGCQKIIVKILKKVKTPFFCA